MELGWMWTVRVWGVKGCSTVWCDGKEVAFQRGQEVKEKKWWGQKERRWRSSTQILSCSSYKTSHAIQDCLMNCVCEICWKLKSWAVCWGKPGLISPAYCCAGRWQTGEDSEIRSALRYADHSPCNTENVKSTSANYFYLRVLEFFSCWPWAEVVIIQACDCCLSQLLLAMERELRHHITTDIYL